MPSLFRQVLQYEQQLYNLVENRTVKNIGARNPMGGPPWLYTGRHIDKTH